MNRSKELIIGIFACICLAILYWGINFLKGENIFSQKKFFYAVYENVDGLTISCPVTVNGFKVGQVSNITLHSKQIADLIVEVTIEEDIDFHRSSLLEIYDSDILGTKSLELKMINGSQIAQSGDTLQGSIANGLTSEVSEQFGSVKVGLDQLIISFDKVLKEVKNLSNTANRILLNNEERLNASMYSIEKIALEVGDQTTNISNVIDNLSAFSDSLNSIDVYSFSNKIVNISSQLELLLLQLNKGDGSLAKILNEDSIYIDLSNTINSMDQLLNDVRENPKKYVNISLWGGDRKDAK